MSLATLREHAERRIRTVPGRVLLAALAGNQAPVDRWRFRRLQALDVCSHLVSVRTVELHRSIMPLHPMAAPAWDHWSFSPKPKPHSVAWPEWNALTIDRITDCVRLLVPRIGSVPITRGDFVRHVLDGLIREPSS